MTEQTVFGCLLQPSTGDVLDAGWITLVPGWGAYVTHATDQGRHNEYRTDQGFRRVTVIASMFSVN